MDPLVASTFPCLASLPKDAATAIAGAGKVVNIAAGTVLFQDGAECASYVLVIDGSIRVQRTAENGREIVLYRVERGQACVLTTNCLITRDSYSAEGLAETAVTALVLPALTFRTLLATSEPFRDFVFAAYATRIADLLLLIEEVAFGRIDMRLAAWLAGRADSEGQIRATHQEIAVELGTAREVVSRQLKEFERRGWLDIQRGRLTLCNRAALLSLSQ